MSETVRHWQLWFDKGRRASEAGLISSLAYPIIGRNRQEEAETEKGRMDYPIQTPRLDMRLLRKSDAEDLFRLHTVDPEALKFIDWRPETKDQFQSDLLEIMHGIRTEKHLTWAILKEQVFIGYVNLAKIEDGEGEIHFFIERSYWKNGFATEAVLAVKDFVRDSLGHRGIRGYCALEHEHSVRVFIKAGFTDLGVHPDPHNQTREIRRFVVEF